MDPPRTSGMIGLQKRLMNTPFRPIGSNPSSGPSISKKQSLIDLITRQLESQTGHITMSRDEALDVVQQLKSSGAGDSDFQESAKTKEELKVFKAHGRLGDYAGKVFNDLKASWIDIGNLGTPQLATSLAKDLKAEEGDDLGPRTLSLERTVETWESKKLTEDDRKMMARLAVYAYSERNLACHSDFSRLQSREDWHGLGMTITRDLVELEDILPAEQLKHEGTWRHIIEYCRDRDLEYDTAQQKWVPSEGVSIADNRDIDLRTLRSLPATLRHIPFAKAQYWDPARVEPHARGRRGAWRSDPPIDTKGKEDESAAFPSRLDRLQRMSTACRRPEKDVVDEEYSRMYGSLEENLRLGRETNLKDAKSFLQRIVGESKAVLAGRGVLEEQEERQKTGKELKEEKKRLKAAKRLQRRSEVEGSR